MIVIVGHGPSVAHVRHDIDQHFVIRLRRAEPILGSRTDVVCSSQARYQQPGADFWHLQGELAEFCNKRLAGYSPSFKKPSTGLSAAILARRFYPDEIIGVAGFDFTLYPDMAVNWRHDAQAESLCLRDVGVIEVE